MRLQDDIRRLFAAARRGVLLLFDEADALFGKRSDVKDSHNRYAAQRQIKRRLYITFTAAVACAAIISYVLYGRRGF
jgi:zona occludens toxin (predicted ATPase)